mmetsp:Transcript_10702/g.30580  ORF Transcript_10702/g.30580 Transcript_10702/m.30580 type:complete len:280 (-) Transcript_10702:139-978(-)
MMPYIQKGKVAKYRICRHIHTFTPTYIDFKIGGLQLYPFRHLFPHSGSHSHSCPLPHPYDHVLGTIHRHFMVGNVQCPQHQLHVGLHGGQLVTQRLNFLQRLLRLGQLAGVAACLHALLELGDDLRDAIMLASPSDVERRAAGKAGRNARAAQAMMLIDAAKLSVWTAGIDVAERLAVDVQYRLLLLEDHRLGSHNSGNERKPMDRACQKAEPLAETIRHIVLDAFELSWRHASCVDSVRRRQVGILFLLVSGECHGVASVADGDDCAYQGCLLAIASL